MGLPGEIMRVQQGARGVQRAGGGAGPLQAAALPAAPTSPGKEGAMAMVVSVLAWIGGLVVGLVVTVPVGMVIGWVLERLQPKPNYSAIDQYLGELCWREDLVLEDWD